MRMRHGRSVALLVGALVAFQWSLTAQSPVSAKRPLTYDVVDSWRSIQGTRLSNDGQWLAYALTSQGDDGEMIVRNLRTNQEYKHPRGTNPTFTKDGKFLVFTIVPTKADDERVAEQERRAAENTPGAAGGAQTTAAEPPAAQPPTTPPTTPPAAGQPAGNRGGQGRGNRGGGGNTQPRNALGIMTLAGGQVTTVEHVGSFRLPEESSTWLAYYKGNGGAGGGRGGRGAAPAGRGGGGGRQGAPQAEAAPQGRGANGAKRKDPGADLMLRNLDTGGENTIPDVVEYDWDTKGEWLVYATSSTDAAKDGAFARRISDGSVKTLLSGRGHYKSLTFNEAGTELAFLSDKDEYDKPVSPYRLYYWKA